MVSLGGEWRGERPARKPAKSGVPQTTITKTATLASHQIVLDSCDKLASLIEYENSERLRNLNMVYQRVAARPL
jgi:hypothetical protein